MISINTPKPKRFFSSSPEKAIRSVIKRRLSAYLPQEAIDDVYKAFLFAEQGHRGQIRKSGEQYIHHPIEVAETLAEMQMDSRTLMAGLLHDVIEDTPASKADLAEAFGEDVAHLVDGVSKIGQIKFDSKEQAEAENFRKMIMAMSEDVRVMIIKLADRLHNMRTLGIMRPDKQKRISKQTLEVYAPIAERLGLYQWARELQDLCFMYMYPQRHSALKNAIKDRQGNRKQVVSKLKTSIESTLNDADLENFSVKGRLKSVFSVYKKMQKKKRTFDELFDIYGFRIVVDSVDECYRVLGIIHNAYKPIAGRFADYIAIPKTNGYQSLHTVVFGPLGNNIEVQIRTKRMDQIAEAGVAAHWVYKSDSDVHSASNHLAHKWLLDLLDPAQKTENAVEFLEHLKTDLYPHEVYVFTPSGEIKKMPRGATALDFAYAVHTDVGTHCTGARINKNLATLPTVLKNGDKVEIITSKNSWPTTAWLNYAVTAKARTNIRSYLKQQTQEDALRLGKRLLAGATKQRLFARRKIPAKIQGLLLEQFKLETWSELLIEIGLGKRLPDLVARQIALLSGDRDQGKVLGQQALVIKGSEGLLVTYSKCCSPVPGDSIIGSFTAGHGLAVHTFDCPNVAELKKHPESFLLVDWHEHIDHNFHAKLRVKLSHVPGAFAAVAVAIAEKGSNIIHVDLQEGSSNERQIDFIVEVKNRVQLAAIIKGIHRSPSVSKVSRHKG